MRRRIALLVATLLSVGILTAVPAGAMAPVESTSQGTPQICVWMNGIYVGAHYLPLYIPRTCTPTLFR